MKRFGLFIVLFLFTPSLAWPQEPREKVAEWPVARGPSAEPVPYKYDRAILKTVPKAYFDDALACIVFAGSSYRLEADGNLEVTSHEVTRLGSRKGIDSLGEYQSITYNPNHQKLTLNEARIHKKNGDVVPIEPRHVQLRDVATDYQIYDVDKQLVISFPNLEVGDVYEVKWTVRGKNPEFGNEFFTRYTFGDDRYPAFRDEIHVVLPSDKPFKFAAINGTLTPSPSPPGRGERGKVNYKVSETGKLRHHQWWVTEKEPLPREDDRPSLEELRLQVAMSTFPSWEAVGKWKHKLRAECWKCGPLVQKVVADVAGPHATPLAKAQALTYWVRRQIRYLSRGPGGAGYTPHLPDHVLGNRYGDCKDQAQLLAVMLKEIGLPVYLVTIGAQDDGHVLLDVPSPWGTHALLLVKIDGKEHWIDTTVSRAAWDFLPRGDRNRQAYVTMGDELQLMRTPAYTWQDNRFDQVSDVHVASDGTATIRRQTNYHQSAALSRRDAWMETPPGEVRRMVLLELQDAFTQVRLAKLNIDDKKLNDFNQPVSARVDFQVPRHFSGEETMEGSLSDSILWSRFLAYNVDHERKLPMQLPVPFSSVHRYRIHLPPVYRFDSLPRKVKLESKFGQFTLDVSQPSDNPRLLELFMETRLEKVRINRDEFAAYQKFRDEVSRAYRVWINFRPTRQLADAPLLELIMTLAPGADVLTGQTLARLYLDSNQSDKARRVLDALLFYHRRDPALWDLRVRAVADPAEEEKVYSTMAELFSERRPYRLALGSVLVRRHNHAAARKVLLALVGDGTAQSRGQAFHLLARSYFATNEFAASLAQLQAAETVDPESMTSAEAQYFLARVHEKLGQTEKALAAYRQAVTADPEARTILGDYIRLQLTTPDAAGALDPVRRFTLLAKDHSALAETAEFHFQLGRWDDAFELANRSRDLGYSSRAQRVVGLVHLRRGEYKEALFHLDRAEEDVIVNEGLLRSCLALGQLTSAESRLDRLQKTNVAVELLKNQIRELARRRPQLLEKLALPAEKKAAGLSAVDAYLCAEFAFREGASQAKALLNLALAQEGVVPGPAYSLHALILLEQGKSTLALADAGRAIAIGPAGSRAHLVRGRVLLQRGQLLGALADLEQAKQLSAGKDAQVLHWLAAAQFQAGQRNKALLTQRQAVDLRPRDEELQAQLREFEKALTKDLK